MSAPKKLSTPSVWSLACSIIAVILFINGVLAYQALNALTENQRDVANTLAAIINIKGAYAALLNAEAGHRGYLLTGEPEYLEPFENGVADLDEHLQELAGATANLPTQILLVEELKAATETRINELRQATSPPQGEETAPVPLGLLSRDGKPKIDGLRELIVQLEQEQHHLLAQREMDARKSRRNTFWTLIAATGASLLLVLLIYFVVKRSSSTRERLTMDLKQANDHLEAKVGERTAALTHYANELQRSNRELQDFAFVASHDLQEPLRKIRAFGNRLQHKYTAVLEEQGADYINRMQAAAERMSRLINDLLAFSRVATKGKPFEETDLNKVMAAVLDDLEVAIEEANADISVAELPAIEADPTQMRQLMQNLLGNAIKFRNPDTQPRIDVSCKIEHDVVINDAVVGDVCEITIADNGIGFDEQFLDRIFTPFQRLHGRDAYEGTGIGLAVCRRIVERHEGSITAESIAGEGAKFVLRLPITQSVKPIHEIYQDDSQ